MSTRILVLMVAAAFDVACGDSEPKTAEEKKARGDQILREMSNSLAGVKNFSFTAEEVSDKVGPGGQKTQVKVIRHVVVRRPDGFTFRTEGGSERQSGTTGRRRPSSPKRESSGPGGPCHQPWTRCSTTWRRSTT